MEAAGREAVNWRRVSLVGQIVLLALFVYVDFRIIASLVRQDIVGIDFLPLWTGARIDSSRLYDFAFVTEQQAWRYVGKVRPFVYPPSALLLLKPVGWTPFWPALVVHVAASGALFWWASRRLGADWRLLLVPPVVLAAVVGQVTFLIGGLVMLALTFQKRPVLAGVLFGLAGAIKPQMLVLLPLALLAERNWRTFVATGVAAAVIAVLSLVTGASWLHWSEALPRFQALIAADPLLTQDAISPYAKFGLAGLIAAVPLSIAAVWFAFRSGSAPLKALALLGGALAVSPYAMDYDLALLAPAAIALLPKPPAQRL